MKTDWVFLPSAGLGTRMGPIGKKIPKPLWSFYGKPILELQIEYCISLGFNHFVVNIHHLSNSFREWMKSFSHEVILLEEEKLLGNGGSFHNIKRSLPDISNLYIFNPDCFLLLSDRDRKNFMLKSKKVPHLLIVVPCEAQDSYNRLKVASNYELLEIIPPSSSAPKMTYSGFGKVDLSILENKEGVSSFFETVAPCNKNQTYIFKPQDPFEYIDLGTLDLYRKEVMGLYERSGTKFLEFLLSIGVSEEEIIDNAYSATNKDVYNFTGKNLKGEEKGIFINDPLSKEPVRIPLC